MSVLPTPTPPPAPAPVTLGYARAALVGLRPRLHSVVALRADLAELKADLHRGRTNPQGGLAEAKALEARLYAVLEEVEEAGAQVKGWAPLLLDWPGLRDGMPVLWCWLEGETDISWYHRLECGFAGRRPV